MLTVAALKVGMILFAGHGSVIGSAKREGSPNQRGNDYNLQRSWKVKSKVFRRLVNTWWAM